eukprot:GHVO01030962.1.p1 GENE.GHVO01030962.1~~GHVO01030962.1.p1  ORF type:complete len:103 (-),score=7.23 GHVO01030962.1:88-396(-)
MQVDGEEIPFPRPVDFFSDNKIVMFSGGGSSILFAGTVSVSIEFDEVFISAPITMETRGICGVYDNDLTNEWTTSEGHILPYEKANRPTFVKSWEADPLCSP